MAAGAESVRITVVVDNHAPEGLIAEHGFALWVEAGGLRILFDTGQGPALLPNAAALGLDPVDLDAIALSHGHYDHAGGLPKALAAAGKARLVAHPEAPQRRYGIRDGTATPNGMPDAARAALDGLPAARRHLVSQPIQLSARVGLTGVVPRETDYEDSAGPFFLDPEGGRPDPFADDNALWIRTASGLIACVGCCHAGLINTLRYIRRLGDGAPLRAVVGGFHLARASERRMAETVRALREQPACTVVPCHCTGERAVAALRDGLPGRVSPGAAGRRLIF